MIVCLRAVHFSAVDDFLSKVIMMTCALAVKASVTFNYSSPVQDHPHSKNQSKAYQVQMKHNVLIFYVLRFSFLEQYFNVWHTVLKYLEPFFFLILRCLNDHHNQDHGVTLKRTRCKWGLVWLENSQHRRGVYLHNFTFYSDVSFAFLRSFKLETLNNYLSREGGCSIHLNIVKLKN